MFQEISGNYPMSNLFEAGKKREFKAAEQSITIDFGKSVSEAKDKSMAEIMGLERDDKPLPKRQVNPNDKRPDVDNDMWGWINGIYKTSEDGSSISNINEHGSIVNFKLTAESVTVDNNGNIDAKSDEYKVLVWKDRANVNTTIRITGDELAKDGKTLTREKIYVIDSKSGKMMSSAEYLDGKGFKYNFNEDGTYTTELVSNETIEY